MVELGTQPSRPDALRTQVQPLISSVSSTVSSSPGTVGSSVVSYAVRTTPDVPGPGSMCRAGTQPEPPSAVTNTNSGQVVSRSPSWTCRPGVTRSGARSG